MDGTDSQGPPVLQAVKTGILGFLGMDREPAPPAEASEEELRGMFRLYEEKLVEMRGNSSRNGGSSQPGRSAVILPATGEAFVRRCRQDVWASITPQRLA